jgi:hypothetical protein
MQDLEKQLMQAAAHQLGEGFATFVVVADDSEGNTVIQKHGENPHIASLLQTATRQHQREMRQGNAEGLT